MASKAKHTLFFLGATGYLGSQFLVLLNKSPIARDIHVVALVRNVTPYKVSRLKEDYQNLSIVEGDLDSEEIIKQQAEKAQYVINCASSDHDRCVKSILNGLTQQSSKDQGRSLLYLHVSGLALVNDNARGEYVDEETIPVYTDIDFSLEQVPDGNPHLKCDSLIMAAGTRKENQIQTIIAYPGWIYGVGEGYRKSTAALRVFFNVSNAIKQMGTWGPGHNSFHNIHVKDAANALLIIFEASLTRKSSGEIIGGHYFLASDEPVVPFREITDVVGDILHRKKIYSRGGSVPLPSTITDALGEVGWVCFGGNHRIQSQRLKHLGWEPTETRKMSLLESLPQEVEVLLQEV